MALRTTVVVILLCIVLSCAWAPVTVSRTLIIGDNAFYLPDEPVFTLSGLAAVTGEILPFTVFASNGSEFTGTDLSKKISSWKSLDDVFDDNFLQAALFKASPGLISVEITTSAVEFLQTKGTQRLMLSDNVVPKTPLHQFTVIHLGAINLPPGPYVVAPDALGTPAVYKPLRLHFDDSQSFFKSVTARSNGSFAVVSASLDTDSSPYIGVPSRIYALEQDKSDFPLAGVRVSVKDIYFLKGIRASAGNRHFYALYPPRNATGPAVRRLMNAGADIVGTTKTVQFANGDRATADWVDYHASFVPRGDGNREPSGSSTGAGSGIASLDFIDVAIGTDTGGSIRGPSGVNGLYGLRPSVGAISLEEVLPLNDVLDTGGFIARDPKLFSAFGKAWYEGSFKSFPSFPKKILLSDDFQSVHGAAAAVYSGFFDKLQTFLGVQAANFSISAHWNATSETGVPISQWLNTTYPTMVAYHQWTVVGKQFFADYAAANGGRNPHINPAVLARWRYGEEQGAEGYAIALEQRSAFENWTLNNFLLEDSETCSDSLYFYPQNAGSYTSREIYYPSVASPPFGFSSGRIAVHARSPDMVMPIGQVPFNSTISGIVEQLPVTVSIVARRGCDFMLLDLLEALADAGIVQTVKTGRTAF
ncbi:hypothetical protein EW146_g1427 [Bondarzewia mesenterica]|uniref:Uncharacterized protein n=1 Tax=Bondarzewia mesenterica TaxID=1095465 RepID=A0A4S4M4C8_9AGAM|nr:hypothetical protein EW146_g1427 [Bondarzewia mesenterica]